MAFTNKHVKGTTFEESPVYDDLPQLEDVLLQDIITDGDHASQRNGQGKGALHLEEGRQLNRAHIQATKTMSSPKAINPAMKLKKIEVSLENLCLNLEKSDYQSTEDDLRLCLLGIFAGRFPSKESVNNLMQRWPAKPTVSFHKNGWMIFHFNNEEDVEQTKSKGHFSIFGIPLILQPLPPFFQIQWLP